jgi:hypothetical protein
VDAGLRVEGVLRARQHGERERLAHLRNVLAVDPDDELLVTGVELRGAVHVRVGAQLLGDVHPQIQARLAIGRHVERLRPDPQRHR